MDWVHLEELVLVCNAAYIVWLLNLPSEARRWKRGKRQYKKGGYVKSREEKDKEEGDEGGEARGPTLYLQ